MTKQHEEPRGLGARRRSYHRNAVAQRIRELRQERGWNQDRLAEQLGIDRRQVVRLETGQAPVTLEVVEALAVAFGVISFVFMWSTVSTDNPYGDFDISWVRRLGQEEIRSHFGAAMERPPLASILNKAVALPDDDLELLDQMAGRMLKASAAGDSDENYSFLLRPQRRGTRRSGPPKGWWGD